jgi:hypothetical protein
MRVRFGVVNADADADAIVLFASCGNNCRRARAPDLRTLENNRLLYTALALSPHRLDPARHPLGAYSPCQRAF